MRHRDIYVQPGYLIRRLHQRSTAEFAAVTNGGDVTQIQLSILIVIDDCPGIDATRISELIGSDRTTIGQALLRLEQKGLICREMGAHDKRTKCLVITDKGKALAEGLSELAPQVGIAILQGLSQREQQTFMRLLTKAVVANEGPRAIGKGLPDWKPESPSLPPRRRT